MVSAGAHAKDEAISLALRNRRATAWRNAAYVCLMHLIRLGRPLITSEDITGRIGQPPSPSQVGAVMNAFATAGWIVRVEMVQAERVNQHAALISRWRPTRAGVDEAGAQDAQGSLW